MRFLDESDWFCERLVGVLLPLDLGKGEIGKLVLPRTRPIADLHVIYQIAAELGESATFR